MFENLSKKFWVSLVLTFTVASCMDFGAGLEPIDDDQTTVGEKTIPEPDPEKEPETETETMETFGYCVDTDGRSFGFCIDSDVYECVVEGKKKDFLDDTYDELFQEYGENYREISEHELCPKSSKISVKCCNDLKWKD